MALTIQYELRSDTPSIRQARKLVEQLRQRALDLPLTTISDVVDLSGENCDPSRRDLDDPFRWLLIQAVQHIQHGDHRYNVLPKRLFAFCIWPGDGSEEANFGLCRYPKSIQIQDPRTSKTWRICTDVTGWRWSSSCKTQHASNPDFGGVENFLKCHLSVITILDHAKALGILGEVDDQGDYWTQRDVKALAQEVAEWNLMIAGHGGNVFRIRTGSS